MPDETFEKYWSLRVQSATARLKAALELIKHKPTRGGLVEGMLRHLIAEYLPQRYAVGTGFLMDKEKPPSNQMDVLVYDVFDSLPLYRDEDLMVLAPGAAKLAVEIKSELNDEGLKEDAAKIKSAKQIDSNLIGVIFAFRSGQPQTVTGHLKALLEAEKAAQGFDRKLLPDKIILLEQGALFEKTPDGQETTYHRFEPEEPMFRFLIDALLAALKSQEAAKFLPPPRTGEPKQTF